MKKTVCKYVVVRFVPHSETDEFANVGVLLYSKEQNFFDFLLGGDGCFRRINHFFKIMDSDVVKQALELYEKELAYLCDAVRRREISSEQAFESLVKPRATMLQFSGVRTAFTESPRRCLQDAHMRMVLQNTPTIERTRVSLKTTLRKQLNTLCLEYPFTRHKFERSGFEASFDFTQVRNGEPCKIIQPIDLTNKIIANDLYKTVDQYETRLSRMDRLGLLPEDVLVTFSLPYQSSDEMAEAWGIVRDELSSLGVLLANIEDTGMIEEFATH